MKKRSETVWYMHMNHFHWSKINLPHDAAEINQEKDDSFHVAFGLRPPQLKVVVEGITKPKATRKLSSFSLLISAA